MNTLFLNSDFFTESLLHFNSQINAKDEVVLTIGNFDGLHLGHQAMLDKTMEVASQHNLKVAVMIFEPMPKEFFNPDSAPPRLMNLAETQDILSTYQYSEKQLSQEMSTKQTVDLLFVADFNDTFRSLTAEQFAQVLKVKLNVHAVVLGDDFRFGHDRKGDSQFLADFGFKVSTLTTVTDLKQQDQRISSTRIRDLLARGDLNQAKQLLGRDYCMIGKVQHGDKIGRTLNFPTANIAIDRIKPALHGVFAVDVQILNESGDIIDNAWNEFTGPGIKGLAKHSLFGTANIGTRPAVNGDEWRLEVHFPQFKGNLYGRILKVRFLHFLHTERNYDSLESLKEGIQDDVKQLVNWLHKQKPNDSVSEN